MWQTPVIGQKVLPTGSGHKAALSFTMPEWAGVWGHLSHASRSCCAGEERHPAAASSEYKREIGSPAARLPTGASDHDSPWIKRGLALNLETGATQTPFSQLPTCLLLSTVQHAERCCHAASSLLLWFSIHALLPSPDAQH